MDNDGNSRSGDEYDQLEHEGPQDTAVDDLDDVHPVNVKEDDIDEVTRGIDNQPDDDPPNGPDKKKPRIEVPIFEEETKSSKEGAAEAPRTDNSQQAPQVNTPQSQQVNTPQSQQQQFHPMINAGYAMPMMPGMVYPPMGFPPMMMMNPPMYGFNPYYNPNTPGYDGGVDKNKSGETKEGEASPQPGPPHTANPAMNAAVAAAMMYNPYMMQHLLYPRQGFPPVYNQNPAVNTRRGISLSLSVDGEMLSEYQLLVRQQLELFEASPQDVESNTQGRKKQVAVGQVGLRCRHCASYPLRARGRGAVYYPAKLSGIYQAAQNMAGSHLCQSCQQIPPMIKAQLQKLRDRRDNASGGKQYWSDGCLALGVYETEQGLRLGSQTPKNNGSDGKAKKEDTNDEPSADAV